MQSFNGWLSSRMYNIGSYLWKFWWTTKRHNVECAEIQAIADDNEKEFPSITFSHSCNVQTFFIIHHDKQWYVLCIFCALFCVHELV